MNAPAASIHDLSPCDPVEILCDLGRYSSHKGHHACWGVVLRVTPAAVVVLNEHGNVDRYLKRHSRTDAASDYMLRPC